MPVLRMIYLGMAVIGAIVPMMYFVPWIQTNGLDLDALVAAWKVSQATTGMYYDLLIAAIALSIWIVAEVYVRHDYWVALICIPATFCIGVSCGLPLYLFLRTRPA